MAKKLTTQNLSSAFLASETQWPQSVVQDYMNIAQNFNILSTQFQALKADTQTTSPAFEPIIGWTVERNIGGAVFDSATGEWTCNATGDYVVDAMARGDAPTGIELQLQVYNGSAWSDVSGAISTGSQQAQISSMQVSLSLSYKLRLVVADTGTPVDITTNNARFSIQRKS
jgi:hypothetical protein